MFDEAFPYYFSIGMTYDQFWDDRPELVKLYQKADEMKNKRKNQEMWLQGIYMRYALASTVGNMFTKKKSDMVEYPSEPLPITKAEAELKKEREAKAAYEKLKAMMIQASQTINR